jgi:hypothetical protein
MRRLLAAVPTTLALTVSGLALTASPAAAAYTTTVDVLPTTETPGHVTGTAASDAPALRIAATDNGGTAVDLVDLPNPDGSVAFDLETWGLADGLLAVSECDAGFVTCTSVPATAFTATDVVPTVTFPTDTTIGQEDYVVTVEDALGGGVLRLSSGGTRSSWATLPSSGASEPVTFWVEGATTVAVFRCSTRATQVCAATGRAEDVTVNRRITASTGSSWDVISTRLGHPYATTLTIQDPETTGPVDLAWQVEQGGVPVEGYAGTASLVRDAGNQVHPSIDLTGLPDGSYEMAWTPSTTTEEFGTVVGTNGPRSNFVVDNTAPPVNRIALPRNNVYPYRDGYRDVATIKAFPGFVDDIAGARLDIIRKSTGRRVRVLAPVDLQANPMLFRWNGRNGAGNPVAGGQYRIRVRAWDAAGNTTRKLMTKEVTVVRKKLAERTMRRTRSAGYSMIHKYTGACSTVRRPALRGWANSLGLYSNTRCTRDFDASFVSTTHATRLPAAARYGSLRVSTYGGAATTQPGSLAYITYLTRRDTWVADTRMGSRLGNHAGPRRRVGPLKRDGRWLIWAVYTAQDARYDVKSFTISMNYWVLVRD